MKTALWLIGLVFLAIAVYSIVMVLPLLINLFILILKVVIFCVIVGILIWAGKKLLGNSK